MGKQVINIRQIHFLTGLITVAHFAITGTLMRFHFFGIEHGDITGRMMFRSNHIYILFAGLLNLLLYFILLQQKSKKALLLIAFILVIAGTIGLNLAFYYDPPSHSIQRDMTRFALIATFSGTVLYLLYFKFWMERVR